MDRYHHIGKSGGYHSCITQSEWYHLELGNTVALHGEVNILSCSLLCPKCLEQ